MFMRVLKNTLILVAFACSLIVTAPAQTGEAGIFAAVKDQFGDAVSDAEIVLGEPGKAEKQSKTDNSGICRFSNLAAGEYQITVSAAGFKEYKSKSIIIKNNETRRIEIVLEIASVESNVEIGADENVADAERVGAATTTINGARQIDFPGRSVSFSVGFGF